MGSGEPRASARRLQRFLFVCFFFCFNDDVKSIFPAKKLFCHDALQGVKEVSEAPRCCVACVCVPLFGCVGVPVSLVWGSWSACALVFGVLVALSPLFGCLGLPVPL